MKLSVHKVSQFSAGELAMGTVQGIPGREKIWIINAGKSKFVVRAEDGGEQLTDQDQIFDSQESALAEIERQISN